MLRNVVKHISYRTARCDGVDCDLFVAAILGKNADKRVNCALGTRVKRMFRNTKVLGRIGGHQDDTSAGVEMPVRLPGDKKLPSGVETEDTI